MLKFYYQNEKATHYYLLHKLINLIFMHWTVIECHSVNSC